MNRNIIPFFRGEEKALVKAKNFVSARWEIAWCKMRKAFKGVIIAVIAVLVAVLFALAPGRKLTIVPNGKLSQEQLEQLRHEITELTAAYQSDCDKLLAEFMPLVEATVAPDFAKATDAVPQVVNQLSGFGNCVSLSYKGAKDKLTGSHDFDKALSDALAPAVFEPCGHAFQVADDQLRTLNLRLQERGMQYTQAIAALGGQYSDVGLDSAVVFKDLQKSLDNFHALVVETQLKTTCAGIGVGLEALFIRSTISAISNLFVKIAGKLAGSASVGMICAAADGPIPIGDIFGAVIAAGGTIWTAWDIYNVSYIMPKKLSDELYNGIAQMKTTLLTETRRIAEELVKQSQENGNQLSQSAMAQL